MNLLGIVSTLFVLGAAFIFGVVLIEAGTSAVAGAVGGFICAVTIMSAVYLTSKGKV